MGCIMSRPAGGAVREGRTPDRAEYYQRHTGLHQEVTEEIESEIVPKTSAPLDAAPSVIRVVNVDLDVKNNARDHHTNEYDITDASVYDDREYLVIRRGQSFKAKVEFSRPYDSSKDELRLVFQFGRRPHPTRGTHIEFILSDRDVPNEWGAFIESTDGNVLSLVFMSPPTCAVGQWRFKIDVVLRDQTNVSVYRYAHKDPLFILFNPWCKDDEVYMADDELLKEYVLNETGKIYSGNFKKITSKPWVFGQFSGDILNCAIYIMDRARLPDQVRGNPVKTVRRISALVNAADDRGVLTGNWSGTYPDGTSPMAWTGSTAILEQYYKTRTPVGYGQCWVFAGVLTSVCRALGIPCRPVTNYKSAHDTDASITIDVHYDARGKPLKQYDADSIWNFHVWNEVWMARPDLPAGYGGWQIVDATPQETSNGLYCMGPASVEAIKRGELYLPHDGPFAFAEVNADRIYWVLGVNGAMQKAYVQKYSIGRSVSTKSAIKGRGSSSDPDRDDLTDHYKFKEGSEEERAAVHRAHVQSSRSGIYVTKAEDVVFEIISDPDTFVGDGMKVTLKLTNTSGAKRTVNGTVVICSMYYTGVSFKDVKEHSIDGTVLEGNEEKSVDIEIPVNEYMDKLTDHCMCKLSCMCMVDETQQTFAEVDELRLRKPHLAMKAPETGNVGKTFQVEVSFQNPLDVTLTQCEIRVEGPGLQKPVVYKQKNVNPKETFSTTFDMTPVKSGSREIIANFNSAQIYGVDVSSVINISA
ncbi:hypothetical protein ACF0H5_006731 [Mactra antiquata]